MEYIKMYEAAMSALEAVTDFPAEIPAPQVTVLLGASGCLYCGVNDITGSICNALTENGETGVAAMMTVWQDGGVDVSSYAFRRALLAWNPKCEEALVILGQAPEFNVHTLAGTMPPKKTMK